jgi:hypothetical protein
MSATPITGTCTRSQEPGTRDPGVQFTGKYQFERI